MSPDQLNIFKSITPLIEEDYLKVFGKKKTNKTEEKPTKDEDDDVLEVGEDGVDISK